MNNLIIIFGILAGSWYLGWRVWAFFWLEKKVCHVPETPHLQVVICARNAAKQLERNLPLWLEQAYPSYQIWVVNDASTDGTSDVLSHFEKKYTHLQVRSLAEKTTPGKRDALAFGLAQLPEGQVVLTDVDCQPSSPFFLKELAGQIGQRSITYLGLGLYEGGSHGVQAVVQFETIQTAYLYYGAAAIGMPYMGVGRNMGYATSVGKSMLSASFKDGLAGGDDDLSISSGLGGRIQLIRGREAWTLSQPPENYSQWWNQKSRHYQTSVYYSPWTLIRLGIDQVAHTGLWVLGLLGTMFQDTRAIGFFSLLMLGMVWCLFTYSLNRRGIKINLFKIGVGDFICTFVIPILWLQAILWKPQDRWT